MIETHGNIAGHFKVLNLVLAHRHFVGFEHQDVGGHEHRIAEKAHVDALVGVFGFEGFVVLDRGLVGMGAVHQSFGRHACQYPGQLGNFRDIGLAIENRAIGIQPQGQPGGGHFQGRLSQYLGVVAFHQGVVIGQEVKTP